MKKRMIVPPLLLLAGCMSGPRPYDGVLGYQVSPTPTGLRVSYVDEARVAPHKTLSKVARVCATELKADAAQLAVKVESESAFEQSVAVNVPIPIGTVASGSTKTGESGHGPGAMVQNTIVHDEAAIRPMKLRKTIATCAR
jgi:hypothetical protein